MSSSGAPKRRFFAVTNLFRGSGGDLRGDYRQAFENLAAAANTARACETRLTVAVDKRDEDYFRDLVGRDWPDVGVKVLPGGNRFPRIADILDAACPEEELLPDRDYIVYMNADINVPYYFFDHADLNLNIFPAGSALVINRKDLLDETACITAGMVHEAAKMHVGFDCFVFPRQAYGKFRLGDCVIGRPPIGALLMTNLLHLVPQVSLLDDSLITWHAGDGSRSSWMDETARQEVDENFVSAFRALDALILDCFPGQDEIQVKTMTHSKVLIDRYISWKSEKP